MGYILTDFGSDISKIYDYKFWTFAGSNALSGLQFGTDEENILTYYTWFDEADPALSTVGRPDGKYQVVLCSSENNKVFPIQVQYGGKFVNNVITIKNGSITVDNDIITEQSANISVRYVGGNIVVSGLEGGENLAVYDMNGRLVQKLKAIEQKVTIPVSFLRSGIYVLRTDKGASAKFAVGR